MTDHISAGEARQLIDSDILALSESVRKLKTQRNALAPISRLPPEILHQIFTSFACLERSDYPGGTEISWIRPLTGVCSYWRAVALECPRLWSSIVFSRPHWAEEMLKRSKMAPLVVTADLTYLTPKMVDAVQMALKHIGRTRELQLTASKATMEKLMDGLRERAPLLECLRLSNPRYSHFLMDDAYTLPDTLFDGDGHRLERLELVKCNIRWGSPLLKGLVHLKLHKTSGFARPTMDQLLDALENMPFLETLDLEDSLPILPDETLTLPPTERVVHLPRLTMLYLSSMVLSCTYLLTHISYPSTTCLKLSCIPNQMDHDFSHLFPAIASVWTGKNDCPPLRSLLIQSLSPKGIRVQGWSASGRTDGLPPDTSEIDIELHWFDFGEQIAEEVAIEVCTVLSLAKLRTLSIYHLAPMHSTSWVRAFGEMTPCVRTVRVRGAPAFGLVSALLPEAVKPGDQLFPNMHKLWIEDTDFGDDSGGETLFEGLRNCLMERTYWETEVREVHLIECSRVREEDVSVLGEIVVDVVWDGIEQGPESESSESELY